MYKCAYPCLLCMLMILSFCLYRRGPLIFYLHFAVVSTLLNFVRMFVRAHDENQKQLGLEKKKAEKEAQIEKSKIASPRKLPENLGQTPIKSGSIHWSSAIYNLNPTKTCTHIDNFIALHGWRSIASKAEALLKRARIRREVFTIAARIRTWMQVYKSGTDTLFSVAVLACMSSALVSLFQCHLWYFICAIVYQVSLLWGQRSSKTTSLDQSLTSRRIPQEFSCKNRLARDGRSIVCYAHFGVQWCKCLYVAIV